MSIYHKFIGDRKMVPDAVGMVLPLNKPLHEVKAKKAEYFDPEACRRAHAQLRALGARVYPVGSRTRNFGFSCHACTGCKGSKCGLLMLPCDPKYKGILHFKCSDCGGRSHDTVFEDYVGMYPNKSMVMIFGCTINTDNEITWKSGTFNVSVKKNSRTGKDYEEKVIQLKSFRNLATVFQENWGEDFSVTKLLADQLHDDLFQACGSASQNKVSGYKFSKP